MATHIFHNDSEPTGSEGGEFHIDALALRYITSSASFTSQRTKRGAVQRYVHEFGDVGGWLASPLRQRLDVSDPVRAFACWAVVMITSAVDAHYVVASGSHWGRHVGVREPGEKQHFLDQADSLHFTPGEAARMWAKLAQISVINGQLTSEVTPESYRTGRKESVDAWTRVLGRVSNSFTTPLFCLDAVMFHRGQGPPPAPRAFWSATGTNHEIQWENVATTSPVLAATMTRYLEQINLSMRVESMRLIDTTLRQLAGYTLTHRTDVTTVAGIDRACIEGYKTWLAARPGYSKRTGVSKRTMVMRLSHLKAFFDRIIEWDYPDTPARNPVFASDRPIADTPLPKFLDDGKAAAFMTAARNLPRQLDRLLIEILAHTGMRKSEMLGLRVDSVVLIGETYWLRTPVGKLHTDRYIPLHPTVKTLIDQWFTTRPTWQATDLLLIERGRPIRGPRVDKAVTRAATAAGIGHVHPHQLRHTLATQAINRGMSLEAIAALLGHRSMSMTMVYARIADRTVAEEYFAVTAKVQALYAQTEPVKLPANAEGTHMKNLRIEHQRMLGNGYCARPEKVECAYDIICEGCTFFQTTIEFAPTLQAQRDDACAKGQTARAAVFTNLITGINDTGT